MKIQLMVNRAAGTHYINEWTEEQWGNWEENGIRNSEGHSTEAGVYDSREEVKEAIVEMRGPTKYCVFFNRSAWEGFVSEEDNLSGNWRGSKHSPYSLYEECRSLEEAESVLEELRHREI